MTANESTPSPGKESSGTADEHSDGQLLAERLEVLAHRVSADLLELAADVRSGEEIDPQDVEDTRRDLSKADAKVRRNFYGVATESEIPADPRERDLSAFVRDNTETTLEEIDGPRRLVAIIAYALERRVKEIITEKGLIDTGTLRASVLAVPGTDFGQLPAADDLDYDEEGNPIDARVSAGAEVTV